MEEAHVTEEPLKSFDYRMFVKCLKEILDVSNEIEDGWKLETISGGGMMHSTDDDNDEENNCFMVKKLCQQLSSCCSSSSEDNSVPIVMFNYHIVYNISYSVPVLCFNAFKQDGTILQLDEYCEYNKAFENVDIWTTLTQLDHPVLHAPFLTLHPCRTLEMMQPFLQKSRNPIVSWLSTVAPYVNLPLSSTYFRLC